MQVRLSRLIISLINVIMLEYQMDYLKSKAEAPKQYKKFKRIE